MTLKVIRENGLSVRWCDDMNPHCPTIEASWDANLGMHLNAQIWYWGTEDRDKTEDEVGNISHALKWIDRNRFRLFDVVWIESNVTPDGDFLFVSREHDPATLEELRTRLRNVVYTSVFTTNERDRYLDILIRLEIHLRKLVPLHQRRIEFQKNRNPLFEQLVKRDGALCVSCKANENLEVDHIVPVSRGGSDDLDNLQILCRSCNASKGNRLIVEEAD